VVCQFIVADEVEPAHSRLFARRGKALDGVGLGSLIKLLAITADADVPREKL